MKAIFFTRRQFKKLQKCKLQKNINHTESELYIIEKKDVWNKHQKMILKYFYVTEGEYFSNKLFTINTLINNTSIIDINTLILPTELAVINNEVVGYIMPFIENKNLLTLLQDFKVSIEKKKDYLKQVGEIINQVHTVSEFQDEFFLGDIHEANFIVNTDEDKVYGVDSDSFKVKNNLPFASKYLATNPNIMSMTHKYPVNEDGYHIPNKNSDLLCYIFTILNTISRTQLQKVAIDEYYEYLDYLTTIGFGENFIRICGKIYTNASNTSPVPYFDEIPDNIYRAAYSVFKCNRITNRVK